MTTDQLQELFDNFSKSGGTVCRDEPLFRHTTWGVGGPADLYYEPETLNQLEKAVQLASQSGIPCLVIGAGSNLLVQDGGVRGLVIQTRKLQQVELTEAGRLRASCGTWLPALARQTGTAGWSGLECLAGIPGTLGGAVVMNAEAYGQSISDCLKRIRLVESGTVVGRDRDQLGFGYRCSDLDERQVVVEAEFQLTPGYAEDLKRRLEQCCEDRKRSQTVGGPNAGSVFKNPVGTSAWKLIDQSGMRGETIGGARVSEVHSNFIINQGGALAADILALIHRVQNRVKTCCRVELDTEVRIVGEKRVDKQTDKQDGI